MTLAKAEDLNVRHKFAAGLYVLGGVSFNPNRRPIGGPAASFGCTHQRQLRRDSTEAERLPRWPSGAGCRVRSAELLRRDSSNAEIRRMAIVAVETADASGELATVARMSAVESATVAARRRSGR